MERGTQRQAPEREGRRTQVRIEDVRRALRGRAPGPAPMDTAGMRPAAVLVPLFEWEGGTHVLFTRRTEEMPTHGGQISFPGGAREPGDASLVEAALREAREEVGLRSEDVEVLGELSPCPTVVSGFVIAPFVGAVPWPYAFTPNAAEIAEIIDVPLAAFLDPSIHRTEGVERAGRRWELHSYQAGPHRIWGATARILNELLDLVRAGR